jgi:peptide/nickel transport system substrate-binding protein
MDAALKQGITDQKGANETWAQVDKEVVDQAPWVTLFNLKYLDFVSKRVKDYTFSPQWYFLLDQASVK